MKFINNGEIAINISEVNYFTCNSSGNKHSIYFVFGKLKPRLENQIIWSFETKSDMEITYKKIIKLCGSVEV